MKLSLLPGRLRDRGRRFRLPDRLRPRRLVPRRATPRRLLPGAGPGRSLADRLRPSRLLPDRLRTSRPSLRPEPDDEPVDGTPSPGGRWRAVARRLRWADLALLVVVAGAVVRVRRWLVDRPLWLDEQMVALNIRDRGYAGLVGELDDNQSAPLGWLWAQRAVIVELGTGERALRLLPLAAGIGTLVVAWWIGRRWLGPVGAVTLVTLCAVAPAVLRYTTEVKQYSGDVFWVLLLVGLAGWGVDHPRPLRRLAVWWVVAAVGSWFSMAAVLVTPALALVLWTAVWRRQGRRAALHGAIVGVGWLVSFALHFALALRYAVGDPFLQAYWRRLGYPPYSQGWGAVVAWWADRPVLLTEDPVGFPHAWLLWGLVLAGVAVAAWRRGTYGLLLATPVVTAVLLAAVHVVPLAARLALWLVPVLFIAVAVAVDAPVRALGHVLRRLHPTAGLAGATAVAVGVAVLLYPHLQPLAADTTDPPPRVNGVDDRAAVRWLMDQRRPGDLVVVTAASWPAVRWYGDMERLAPVRRVRTAEPGADCSPGWLRAAVAGHRRVISYAGIHLHPYPATHLVVQARLVELGRVVTVRRFGVVEVTVADLARPPATPPTLPILARQRLNCVAPAPGARD